MQSSSTLRRLALAAAVTGAAIMATPALANAASFCTFSTSVPGRVEVFDGSGSLDLFITRAGQFISIADGGNPEKLCPGPTGTATVFNTDLIFVHANPAFAGDHFGVDTLAPGKTPESDGRSEVETIINSAAPNFLNVSGTAGADTMRVAQGGGVMLGSDLDVDVRDSSANHVFLFGNFGNDFLSGRGGSPASTPGPATTTVTMFGGEGDDTVVDGPLAGDNLQGEPGNDTLFSHDLRSLDRSTGSGGFDQATMDQGDLHPVNDIERLSLVGVGHLRLDPTAVTARAGRPVRVTLAWRHPKAWRQLRSLKLRASDAGDVVATITIDPARGRISDRGAISATSRSKVDHRGKTVTAHLELRPSERLADRRLHLAVEATDAKGRKQVEPLAGQLAVAR